MRATIAQLMSDPLHNLASENIFYFALWTEKHLLYNLAKSVRNRINQSKESKFLVWNLLFIWPVIKLNSRSILSQNFPKINWIACYNYFRTNIIYLTNKA